MKKIIQMTQLSPNAPNTVVANIHFFDVIAPKSTVIEIQPILNNIGEQITLSDTDN